MQTQKLDALQCIWRDALQYRLEESISHQRNRRVTQLFTLFTDAQAV